MKNRLFALILVLAVAGCASSTAPTATTDAKKASPELKVLRDAPDFDLEDVLGGRVKSADLKGKVVIIDFWATYCQPCKKEIPEYVALMQKLNRKDVAIIGVTFESGTAAEVKPYLPEFGVKYPVAMGTDKINEDFGGFIGLPTTFIVGKDWKVYKRYIGSTPTKIADIESMITALVDKQGAS